MISLKIAIYSIFLLREVSVSVTVSKDKRNDSFPYLLKQEKNVKEDTAKAADHLMTTRLLRTLKDNYDLGYDTLDDFKERYKLVFFDHFGSETIEAIELIEKELDKKK